MKKAKSIISHVDNFLREIRKVFVNTLTVLFLLLITFGSFFGLVGSLFSDNEVKTENQILYLELNGVVVDKAITRNNPFEEFEIFVLYTFI